MKTKVGQKHEDWGEMDRSMKTKVGKKHEDNGGAEALREGAEFSIY